MGDKICNWVLAQFPVLCRWVNGMSEWEAVAFALGLMVLGYLIYAAAWNAWLYAAGLLPGQSPATADKEDYEPWMDYEKWRAE